MMESSDFRRVAGERPTASAVHDCPVKTRHLGISRLGPGADLPEARYGPAFEQIEYFDGRWWAHNDEYATEVTFCPWCGSRLDPESQLQANGRVGMHSTS
jgi:hypothetical protein